MAESPAILVNDSIRRQVLLEGVKANEADKFAKYLKDLEKGIRVRLANEGMTIRNRSRLAALLVDVRKLENEAFDGWIEELSDNLDEIAITEAKLESGVLNKSLPAFEAVLPSESQILTAFRNNPLSVRGKSQGLTLKPFLQQYTSDQKALIEGVISQGFIEGTPSAQIAQNLRGTKALGFNDGQLAAVNRNTNIMVRTAVQNASSQARQSTWEANTDVITGVEWVSTLDSRTTSQCRSLDGQIFAIDDGPRPPLHYGCRSTTAPVVSSDYDFLKASAKRPSRGEEKNGNIDIKQVNQSTSYYSWLKTQPAQFQDKVLGGTRGRLLRSGGLDADQFARLQLNSNFKPMTLQEMAKEAPEAFEQANLLDDSGNVIVVKRNNKPS